MKSVFCTFIVPVPGLVHRARSKGGVIARRCIILSCPRPRFGTMFLVLKPSSRIQGSAADIIRGCGKGHLGQGAFGYYACDIFFPVRWIG